MPSLARRLLTVAIILSSGSTPALAQPAAAPEPRAPAAGDPAALERAYAAAFAALVRGDYRAAVAGFDAVARESTDAERRGAARELARLARAQAARASAEAAPVPAAERAEDDRPGAGRIEVVAASTAASFYAGFVPIDAFDLDDFRAGALVVSGTTAAGFGASFFLTRGRDITGGMADAYTSGLAIGVANALLVAGPAGVEPGEDGYLPLGLAGMALGGAAGLVLADHARPTRAQVNLTSTLGLMGIATVGLGAAMLPPDTLTADQLFLGLAGGLDVGTAAGALIAPRIAWSKGRARLVTLGAFLGAVAGVGGAAIAVGEPDTDAQQRAMAGAVLGGSWAGLLLTARWTRGMAPDPRFARDAEATPTTAVPLWLEGGGGVAIVGRL